MKHNLKSQKNISRFHLKQQFVSLLSNEFEKCGFDIVLGFESSFRERICTLQFVDGKQVEIRVNLGYVKKSINVVGCSLIFKVCYCALFVAEYIKQIERAKNSVPQSYFEGLVFLNAIEVCKTEKTVSIYSPLSNWYKKPKRTYCVRPLEISSAINSLNKLRLLSPSGLNEQDKVAIKAFGDNLLLYSSLPEVAYIRASVPVYTMVDSLKRLAELIAKESEAVQEFPILTLAPFEQIEQMTASSLFLSCVQSNDEFLLGVAIRLIAFLHIPYGLEHDNSGHEKLVDEMNLYIDYSITYCNEISKSGRCLIHDNFLAIKKAAKSINDYLIMYGTGVVAGNIHSIV